MSLRQTICSWQLVASEHLEHTMKPIPDKAEVALEYPDKLYIGTFERTSDFDAHLDEVGIALTLHHGGDENVRKSVRMHIHYALFAEILTDLAASAAKGFPDDGHRQMMAQAAADLAAALRTPPSRETADAEMTAEEEVTLLHIME
jgi:hypothetical protein